MDPLSREDRSGHPVDSPHANPARWAELIESVQPASMLVVIASSMSRKLQEHYTAEDIWQETLSQAWRDRDQHQWRDSAAFRGWLFQIARNRIRQAARQIASTKRGSGRSPARFSELDLRDSTSAPGLMPADLVTPSRIAARGEKAEVMQKTLAMLPSELQRVVRLHVFEGLTMEAIAK